jgi:hypothetical protein
MALRGGRGPSARWIALACGLVLTALSAPAAMAGSMSLAWDAIADPAVVGYRLYYGTTAGAYTNSVNVGAQTSYNLANLQDCTTYHVAVKAVDSGGRESALFSSEIVGMPAPVVTGITPSAGTQGASLNVTISGSNFDTQAHPDFVALNAIEGIVGPDLVVNSFGSVSCNQIVANLAIAPAAWVNDATRPRLVGVVNQPRQPSDGNGILGFASDVFRVLFDARRADIDGSGRVMDRDFLFWRNAFGSAHGTPPAPPDPAYSTAVDLNGDGVVDGVDLALLVSRHAYTCDSTGCHP